MLFLQIGCVLVANCMIAPLLERVDAGLLTAPTKVLRLFLHPKRLAGSITNLPQWRAHFFNY